MESNRVEDINGWYEIKDNPLSKVGVYPYLGSSIDFDGSMNLDPDAVYSVYRPANELSSPDCIDSFKLIPWVNEHDMLGDEEGTIAAENKGIEGVIGEDVFFDSEEGILKGNIKVFSENLKKIIDGGKDELSCGYRCTYELSSGVFDGDKYDIIQRNMRGNHLASVGQGRMGPEVSVLDDNKSLFRFTIDSKDFVMTKDKDVGMEDEQEEKKVMSLDDIFERIKPLMKAMSDFMEVASGRDLPQEDEEVTVEIEGDEEEAEDAGGNGPSKVAASRDLVDNKSAMDRIVKENKILKDSVESLKKSALDNAVINLGKKNDVAERLSQFVGSFDHSEMTIKEVAKYGVDKLSIPCEEGYEAYALDGYLYNREASTVAHSVLQGGHKSEESLSVVDKYLRGEK